VTIPSLGEWEDLLASKIVGIERMPKAA